MEELPIKEKRFWTIVASTCGFMWGVYGVVIDGLLAGIILAAMGFVGTLFMAGVLKINCRWGDKDGE